MEVNNSAAAPAATNCGTSAIYLWIGLKPKTKQGLSDSFGGEIGIAQLVAEFAAVVEEKFNQLPDDLPGVFHYEVVEVLGQWLGEHPAATIEEFKTEMDRLTAQFMAQ
jgi:hypothetical protein